MSTKRKQTSGPGWPARILLILFGAGNFTLGLEGLRNGVIWFPLGSSRTGQVNFVPTAGLVGVGLLVLLIGLIPWGALENLRKKRKP